MAQLRSNPSLTGMLPACLSAVDRSRAVQLRRGMQKILEDLMSPAWWFGVVIASFVVNLLASYAKPLTDKMVSNFSKTRKRLLEDQEKETVRVIERMLRTPDGIVLAKLEELSCLVLCAVITGLGIGAIMLLPRLEKLFPTSLTVILLTIMFFLIVAIAFLQRALRLQRLTGIAHTIRGDRALGRTV